MIQVIKIYKEEDLQKVFAIRDNVFVQGQNVPAYLEHVNVDVSHHFLQQ